MLVWYILPVYSANQESLEKMWKYSQYVDRIENLMKNMSQNQLEDLQSRVDSIPAIKWNDELKYFLQYLDWSISSYLYASQKPLDVSKEEVIPTFFELTLSEKEKVEKEINKIQWDLQNELSNLVKATIVSYNSMTQYTEKWDISVEMQLEIENEFSLWAGINISDYIVQYQNLDAQFSANIDGFYEIAWGFIDEIQATWNTDIQLVQKWQDVYLLMKDTEFSTNNEEIELEITPIIKRLNELGQNNTYISYVDENSAAIYTMLEYFSQDNIQTEINTLFSENLLEAYGKNDSGYLLRPTKHLCDTGKRLTNVFDPFNGDLCSEWQYENMLEDFEKSQIGITLTTWRNMSINISNSSDRNANEIINIDFIWENASFNEIVINVIDAYDSTEYINAQYIVDESLSIDIPKRAYTPWFMLDMNFGRNSEIKSFIVEATYEDEMEFSAIYNNRFLTSNYSVTSPYMELSCEFKGRVYQSYADIKGWCEAASPLIPTPSQSIYLESSLLYDARYRNNDLSWDVLIESDSNNYLDFNIQGKAQRINNRSSSIKAPANTIEYLDFIQEITPEDSYYYDDYETDYEYEYNSYDDYDEACYLYDSWDRTCHSYFDDKDITCEYLVETDTETCETYEYNY